MTISDLTVEKLRELIAEVVEEKLIAFLGDPDAGLAIREDVRERLLRSRAAVERGAPTIAMAVGGGPESRRQRAHYAEAQLMSGLTEFRNQLTEAVERRGLTVTTWRLGGRSSRNLIELSTTPKRTVLYVKWFSGCSRGTELKTGRPGFWGLTKNQLTRLKNANVRWFVVLLLQSSTAGYLLTRDEVLDRTLDHTADRPFKLSGGDYKVWDNVGHLNIAQRFQSLQDLLERIL